MSLRYDERTGEFVETGGGSRRSPRGPSRTRGSSRPSRSGSSSSVGSAIKNFFDKLFEKIGEALGCLFWIWILSKIVGCIF